MERKYFEEEVFDKINFTGKPFPQGEYENCSFINCNLSNTDLSGIRFTECSFTGCNIGLAKLSRTSFQDAKFVNCKLLGLHFDECESFLFTVSFNDCLLNLSSFYGLKMKKIQFIKCSLHEVDFTGTDLSAAILDNCDLHKAIFADTILEKADFRNSYNFSIDPERNRIKKAKFSKESIEGLLDKYQLDID